MDLRYSDIDEDFRSRLREWLAEEVPQHGAPPAPGDWLARRQYDTSWQRKLFDAGYAGLGWPAEYGGAGAPLSQQLIYYEETAAAGAPPLNACYVGLMHGGPTLIMEGTEDQKRRHLPGILRGDEVWCQGFSEPQAGSDLASLRTRAVRQGDEYVIHGQKIWSTRAHIADYCELLVRTDPSQTKHGGITWLILPMDQPGVDIRPIRTVEGDSDFCELFLEGARVPVENRVGEENDGWRVANVTLRLSSRSRSTGAMPGATRVSVVGWGRSQARSRGCAA
jgi:alkylation response protein AidB-like acyl-CoA dehydrogenase